MLVVAPTVLTPHQKSFLSLADSDYDRYHNWSKCAALTSPDKSITNHAFSSWGTLWKKCWQ